MHENAAQPRPIQVYTAGKINGHRSAIESENVALAGGRQLAYDQCHAGDTAGVTLLGTGVPVG